MTILYFKVTATQWSSKPLNLKGRLVCSIHRFPLQFPQSNFNQARFIPPPCLFFVFIYILISFLSKCKKKYHIFSSTYWILHNTAYWIWLGKGTKTESALFQCSEESKHNWSFAYQSCVFLSFSLKLILILFKFIPDKTTSALSHLLNWNQYFPLQIKISLTAPPQKKH